MEHARVQPGLASSMPGEWPLWGVPAFRCSCACLSLLAPTTVPLAIRVL